jgi:SMI1 / KNR4 family (SUKH-1)
MAQTLYPRTVGNSRPTSRDAIVAFQRRFQVTLPPIYIGFLLATNGGQPERPTFPIHGLALNPLGSVHCFFGLAPELTVYDLTEIMTFFENRVANGVVPIASNSGSDYICLDLRSNSERVVFWDHSHFWSTGEWRESDLYFIANSFEDFLKSLRPNPY